MQALSDRMKMLVEAEFQPQLARLARLAPGTAEAVEDRTYPWFFFR